MAKTFTGMVVSNKANKTIVVSVATRHTHPIYKKQYTTNRKFMSHDESNEAHVGDKVTIVETKPLSARKRFNLVRIDVPAVIRHEEPVTTEPSLDSKHKAEEKA